MALNLPPDPYKALGVSKDAQLPEIRSAHRKLVLKCHPDKVQDAALKAIKQDEFQKVQQAYELLSDDKRREQYDDQFKLFELRKEMGRGNPTPRSNPFEYEVRTAEPRPNTYPRTKPSPQPSQPSPKVYSQTPPRSYEDVMYDEPKAMPRKTASYESTDRKRTSARDEDRRRREDDEKARQKLEKEKEKERKHAHSKKEKEKSRDKEKRRGTEEKHSRQTAYVHEESDEYVPPRPAEKKSSRHRVDDDFRPREAEPVSIKEAPLAPKWDKHMEYAGQYMQAARRKVAPAEEDFVHPGLRRAETYAAPSYNVRHVAPQFSDDDAPRRSSARKESKRASEAPTPRTRDKSSKGSSRKSPATSPKDPYIVEPPSPPPVTRKPTLQTRSSAPPDPTSFSSSQRDRDRPHRSKTQDYPRNDPVPPMPRAQTFAAGDRKVDRSRDRGGSRLKKKVDYSSAESDSDSPAPQPQRRSHTPPRRPAPAPEPTRYIIDKGRSVPITTRHRSDLRDLNEDHYQQRDRSESPHGRRSRERSSGTRNTSSRQVPIRSQSQSQNYYPPDAPDPVIHTVRPKMPQREGTHQGSRGGATGYFNDVKFAPKYTPENLIASGYLSEE
ncbi:DnaJ protein ERDJ3A [Lachnellula arida]|uniref:DnaJ protein ERDJ3A n=1 Tax=Lachnellula arida TaxID=1316785 RepID=A0A8T9B1G2_9HELO|nr:DnaJ protein ERDJ3A [Lachnellula arida]